MLSAHPCGVSIRHSPNCKQILFCGKHQISLWQVLTFCEKKLLPGILETKEGIFTSVSTPDELFMWYTIETWD